ncbi:MAG: hypothetical protein PHC82_03965 [Candidatus Pacebacteria bacterium]|nr:hypothetical protein [Candidatus Paceibacterota bacterium]
MANLPSLRRKHPSFVYEKYEWNISRKGLEIFFDFRLEPDIKFRPKILIERADAKQIERMGKQNLNNLVFNLGLAEMISYWKAACPPEIIINAGPLNTEQKRWWKWLAINGLGQFFYENKINFLESGFLKITAARTVKNELSDSSKLKTDEKILVPMGGGKDSAATLEILKQEQKDLACFALNPAEETVKTIKAAGCKNPIFAQRKIDSKLIELNQKGYLNGHTPFSAYLAFLTTLTAAIFGCRHIAVSNERSSNEATLKYLGKNINHQWSKTFSFEKSFKNYSRKHLTEQIGYFSFLRPLYEIQIAEIFSSFKKYHPIFLSCNEAHKTYSGTKKPAGKWCCGCSKCLFAFIILYPFLGEKETVKIFGENLFENKKLLETAKELTGEKDAKPLECVGTRKESNIAFYLSLIEAREKSPGKNLPFLLDYFEKNIFPKNKKWEKDARKIMSSWNKQNNLPKSFDKILKKHLFSKQKTP